MARFMEFHRQQTAGGQVPPEPTPLYMISAQSFGSTYMRESFPHPVTEENQKHHRTETMLLLGIPVQYSCAHRTVGGQVPPEPTPLCVISTRSVRAIWFLQQLRCYHGDMVDPLGCMFRICSIHHNKLYMCVIKLKLLIL
jgi:hypothetical protein